MSSTFLIIWHCYCTSECQCLQLRWELICWIRCPCHGTVKVGLAWPEYHDCWKDPEILALPLHICPRRLGLHKRKDRLLTCVTRTDPSNRASIASTSSHLYEGVATSLPRCTQRTIKSWRRRAQSGCERSPYQQQAYPLPLARRPQTLHFTLQSYI